MFNIAGMTPIRSAAMADLHEAFTYLSAKKAEAKFHENLVKNSS